MDFYSIYKAIESGVQLNTGSNPVTGTDIKILKIMSNIFINTEIQKPLKPYNNNNCPPGYYVSIQAGGNGHSVGDGLQKIGQKSEQVNEQVNNVPSIADGGTTATKIN